MNLQAYLAASALLCLIAQPIQARPVRAPRATIDSGPIVGVNTGAVDRFLGLPYAAPPVGALRWNPPVAPARWRIPRRAAGFADSCAQNRDMGAFAGPSQSEDCLYLNVFVRHSPRPNHGSRPVMVWFHGGGLFGGGASAYDGSGLARAGDAVVVTVNYRLGVLGFYAHPALDREAHDLANYGLLDQRFALQWVRRNARAFGGDPDNVTIFGESSGCASVLAQMASPGSAGLFHRAICHSGAPATLRYPAFGASRPLAQAETMGTAFATAAGCPQQQVSCLRALPVRAILAAQTPYLHNQPVIDGTVEPVPVGDALRSGHFNHVPLINGSNRDEWRWAAALDEQASGRAMALAGYPRALAAFYGPALAPLVAAEYSLSAWPSAGLAFAAATTDSLYACPALQVDQILGPQIPVYAFEFADRTAPSYLAPVSFAHAAEHTSELQYLFPRFHGFDGTPHRLTRAQFRLSVWMTRAWTGFARSAANRPWDRYDPARQNIEILLLPRPVMRAGTFSADHHCAFWNRSGLY